MNWILAKSEKPYSWGHCDEKFNQKQNLNQHEMVQTGEKTLFMQVLLSEIQAVKRTWIDTAWFKDTIPMQVLSLWFKVKSHLTTDKSCCFDPWRGRAIQYNGIDDNVHDNFCGKKNIGKIEMPRPVYFWNPTFTEWSRFQNVLLHLLQS